MPLVSWTFDIKKGPFTCLTVFMEGEQVEPCHTVAGAVGTWPENNPLPQPPKVLLRGEPCQSCLWSGYSSRCL